MKSTTDSVLPSAQIDNTTDVITPEKVCDFEACIRVGSPALSESSQVDSDSDLGTTVRSRLLSCTTALRSTREDANIQSPSIVTTDVSVERNRLKPSVSGDDALTTVVGTHSRPVVLEEASAAVDSNLFKTEASTESHIMPLHEQSIAASGEDKDSADRCDHRFEPRLMSWTAKPETLHRSQNPQAISSHVASRLQPAVDPPSTSAGITHSGKVSLPVDHPSIAGGQENHVQIDSTPRSSLPDAAARLQHVGQSYSMSGSDRLYPVSHESPSAHKTHESMQTQHHSCVTPPLLDVMADAESEKAESYAHRHKVAGGRLQALVHSAHSSKLGATDEGLAITCSDPSALPSPPDYAPSVDEMFSTPSLTLLHGTPPSDEQQQAIAAHTESSIVSDIQPVHNTRANACKATQQAVHPHMSHVPYTPSHSQMTSQHRRAKARASISYSGHSDLPWIDHYKPHSGRFSRSAVADPRSSMSGHRSAAWRRSQRMLSDFPRSPRLSLVQTIPEADAAGSEQELSSTHSGSPVQLTALEQVLVACGQVSPV